MNQVLLPPPTFIDSDYALANVMNHLQTEPLVAVDTESNSLYAYRSRVCLIQLSTRTQDYIIDPLMIQDMQPFGELMMNPDVEKIFHAAEYDLICLKQDYGFGVQNLFDTMIAARICGENRVGLNNLVQTHLGIELDKSHQLDDWGKRPLSDESLQYAQMDTHFLPQLRDIKFQVLEENGQLEEALEVFCDAARLTPPEEKVDPDGFWDLGKPHALNRREYAILRELYLLREQLAEEKDRPPFKIMMNKLLVQLARKMPRTKQELQQVNGLSSSQIRRFGAAILDAIREGFDKPLPDPPAQKMPPTDVADRYTLLHTWRKRRARQRGVESNIILTKDTLWELAYKPPSSEDELVHIGGMGPWRRKMYGDEIIALLESYQVDQTIEV